MDFANEEVKKDFMSMFDDFRFDDELPFRDCYYLDDEQSFCHEDDCEFESSDIDSEDDFCGVTCGNCGVLDSVVLSAIGLVCRSCLVRF